jgi:hypothetical protein
MRKKMLSQGVFTVLATALLFWPSVAHSQTVFGSITGVVTDSTGAVIPNALVTAVNRDTGFTRSGATAANGVYTIPDLLPGTYRVGAQAKGFSSLERAGIVLDADHVVNVDIQLTVGAASTHVEVVATAPVINTETATTSYIKASTELVNLPLTVRQTNSSKAFEVFVPGVGTNDSGNYYGPGTRQMDTYFSNDGIVEMADMDGTGGTPLQPDLDALAEINYITVDAPAEFHSAYNVMTVSKSGTNQFHGDLFYSYSGTALNGRNFFATSPTPVVFNDFAGAIGGPISRSKKTFFFADYEGLRNPTHNVVADNTPLTPWRTGNFSGQLNTSVQTGTDACGQPIYEGAITNPYTGCVFLGNQITSGLISPVSQQLQSYFFPPPNYGPPTLQAGNWRGSFSTPLRDDIMDARVDHYFSERDSVYLRYGLRNSPENYQNGNLPPIGANPETRFSTEGIISYTHTFAPTLLNEFRFGFGRDPVTHHSTLIGSNIIAQAGIQGITTTGIDGVPTLNISGITSTDVVSVSNHKSTNFEWSDNLSWTRGGHAFKFGADFIRDQLYQLYDPDNIYGTYSFANTFTGAAYADFLLGLPTTTALNPPVPSLNLRGTLAGFYAQDAFKLTPRITLTYGVRYELPKPYYDTGGRLFSYDPTNGSLVVNNNAVKSISPLFPTNIPIVTASQAGYPAGSLMHFNKKETYPRIGLAYKLTSDGKTAIRAGYGIFGNTIYGAIAESLTGGPFAGSETFYNSITNGVPLFSFPDPFAPSSGQVATFENVSVFNPHLTVPYTQQWNVTLERQVGSVGLSLAYVGAHTVGLLYPRNINQPPPSTTPFSFSELPNPNLSTITWSENGGSEEYNSLQISAVKRVAQGLTFNSGYTWARDLTDQLDNDWVTAQEIQNQFNRAAEWGNHPYTPAQRFYADALYALPFGRSQRFLKQMPGVEEGFLGGWRLSAVGTLTTGKFYTPSFDGFDPSNTNNFGGRPDDIPSVALYPAHRTINQWFSPAAFAIPGCPATNPVCSSPADVGRFGNAGNSSIEGPPLRDLDLSLMKQFHITESMRLTFQAIFSNVFNHPSFGPPALDISSPGTVGTITSTYDANGSVWSYSRGSYSERVINFAGRIDF